MTGAGTAAGRAPLTRRSRRGLRGQAAPLAVAAVAVVMVVLAVARLDAGLPRGPRRLPLVAAGAAPARGALRARRRPPRPRRQDAGRGPAGAARDRSGRPRTLTPCAGGSTTCRTTSRCGAGRRAPVAWSWSRWPRSTIAERAAVSALRFGLRGRRTVRTFAVGERYVVAVTVSSRGARAAHRARRHDGRSGRGLGRDGSGALVGGDLARPLPALSGAVRARLLVWIFVWLAFNVLKLFVYLVVVVPLSLLGLRKRQPRRSGRSYRSRIRSGDLAPGVERVDLDSFGQPFGPSAAAWFTALVLALAVAIPALTRSLWISSLVWGAVGYRIRARLARARPEGSVGARGPLERGGARRVRPRRGALRPRAGAADRFAARLRRRPAARRGRGRARLAPRRGARAPRPAT